MASLRVGMVSHCHSGSSMPLVAHHAGLQARTATVGASVLIAGVTPHTGLECSRAQDKCSKSHAKSLRGQVNKARIARFLRESASRKCHLSGYPLKNPPERLVRNANSRFVNLAPQNVLWLNSTPTTAQGNWKHRSTLGPDPALSKHEKHAAHDAVKRRSGS
jgi:hypothetical protein